MQIASLFARIGLKTDEEKAKSFVRSMNNAKATLIAVGTAVGTASAAIIKVTSDALDAAAAFKQFEVETGSSAQELQRWQAVAEQTNSSAEAVSAAIRAITSNQEQIRLGQGNISGFQLLGIDPRQDPFVILEQLRERTDGLSQAMKRNVLAQLGVGAGLLQTLELSNEQFDDLARRAFIISPQAIETLAQTRASMNQAARGVEFLKAQIAVALAPEIRALTDQFIDFIKHNEDAFIKGFRQAYTFVQTFLRGVNQLGRAIDWLVRGTIGWERALKVLIGALVLFNAQLLLSPLGIFTAGITLLFILLEDLYGFAEGRRSLFGVFLEQFPRISEALEPITSNLEGFKDVLRDIFTENSEVENAAEEWGRWASAIERVVDAVRNFLRLTVDREARIEAGEEFTAGQEERRENRSLGRGIDNLRDGLQTVGELFRGERAFGDLIRESRTAGTPLFQPQSAPVTNNVDATITIDGSQTPRATAAEVQREIQRAYNATSGQRSRIE